MSKFNPSQHFFAQVPQADIQRSSFDRSSAVKTTFNEGWLVPIFLDEILPGDTVNITAHLFARLATPLTPFMDNLYMDVHWFFCPMRLLWSNWVRFMGEQDDPDDSTDYLVPQTVAPATVGYVPPSNWASPSSTDLMGALADYLGLPTRIPSISINVMPLRMYNLTYNQWYRDQNLQDHVSQGIGDGPDTVTNYRLKKRNKRHDYFTSCLPWPQKADAVTVPLLGNAPVKGLGVLSSLSASGTDRTVIETGGASVLYSDNVDSSANTIYMKMANSGAPSEPQVYADLAAVTSTTINTIRQAFQIQKLYERDARGGTRYTEIVHSHFGVVSPDARLQRVEFLGGGTVPINVTPIAQNSATSSQPTPQGHLTGMGVGSGRAGFVKSFTEHGYIMCIVSVRADMTYQSGLSKLWTRQTRLDYYWPVLANLGEQAVLNKEIYCQGVAADDDVFGYQERYAEYRYKPSQITGKFRSNDPTTLDVWHLAQKFTALPVLGDTFIQESPPVDRVVAVTQEPRFIMDGYFKHIHARPMPTYSVPGLIDHF